jgi:opacity protein-like surface antigen
MRLRRALVLAVAAGCLLTPAVPAFADITAFLGAAGGPSTRVAKGLAVGGGISMLGWEVEYSNTGDEIAHGSPRLQTAMVNGLVQTPFGVGGMQFYGTLGAGMYHESLPGVSQTNVGVNGGLGMKMALAGPLRLRVDYRVTRLVGSPIGSAYVHRFYVGANVKF